MSSKVLPVTEVFIPERLSNSTIKANTDKIIKSVDSTTSAYELNVSTGCIKMLLKMESMKKKPTSVKYIFLSR
jgi:hypothetical protein